MSLGIYFPEDIRNAILAADEASGATAAAIATETSHCRHVPIVFDSAADVFRCDICGKEWKLEEVLDLIRTNGAGRHYRRGYRAALVTLALAFGLAGTPSLRDSLFLPDRQEPAP